MISKEELEKWAFQLNMDGDCDATDKDIETLITQVLDTMEELETAKRCLPVDKEFEVKGSWIGSVQNYIAHLEESLEVMDSEPVAALKLPPKRPPRLSNDRERSHELNVGVDIWNQCIDEVAKINGEMIIAGRLDGLHPSIIALVNGFATALAEKLSKAELKYGYNNAWTNNGWMTECLADFHRHIAKGDPRDVAAYCAFMWYHGWKTEPAQPALERDQVRREHAEWSQATFGNVGPIGPLKHLSKEALEAAAEPDDLSEWADMQFLMWDAQRRAGITDDQITQAMIEKLAVNKNREWPEPKDGEPRLHIKEQSAPKLFKTREDHPGWFQSEEEKQDAIKNIQQGLDVVKSRASECWDGLYNVIKGRGKRSEGDFTPDLSMSPEEFIREFRKLASSSTPGPLYYHATGEWIPMSEQMPENKPGSFEYLVFETLTNRVNYDYWNVPGTGEEFTPFWNHYGDYVTHWMPLPAGPKEQDNV
ncbi:dATP/dGTP pyrophosphohydrolase [Klebsiella phage phi1_175008]|uniref:dATP/dGTP pyrophosphohydrolase n=2 Tax=Klebsiella phage phi1_175008 TaxID=3127744 RepID=A0ACD5FQT9_9CAUD